ncbi:hypothetical protein [Geodermatophilus sp. SYSU D00710]
MPVGTLPRPRPGRAFRPVLPTGLSGLAATTGLLTVLLAGAVALAAPAAAADDPARPDSRVTHGPSCRPGGVVVEVTAGTVAYAVTLATTRAPEGEASAELQPGQVAVLRTAEVAWGETVDSRLEFTALDGSGTTYVDELEGFVFTRPAEEDCAAIAVPPGGGEVPPVAGAPAMPPAPDSAPEQVPVPPGDVAPAPEVAPLPVPDPPAPDPAPGVPGDGGVSPGGAVVASAGQVTAGDAVILMGAGFTPGEVVTVQVADGRVLASVAAGPDGEVEATVRVPGAAGTTTLALVGTDSEVTAVVELRVAAAASPVDPDPVPVPLVLAGLALVVTATGLVLSAGRRREPSAPSWPAGPSWPTGPTGSA